MAKSMILGVKDKAGLWLLDFEAGTVIAMDGKRDEYVTVGDIDVENEEPVDVAFTL